MNEGIIPSNKSNYSITWNVLINQKTDILGSLPFFNFYILAPLVIRKYNWTEILNRMRRRQKKAAKLHE
jgi:hypothetical protein